LNRQRNHVFEPFVGTPGKPVRRRDDKEPGLVLLFSILGRFFFGHDGRPSVALSHRRRNPDASPTARADIDVLLVPQAIGATFQMGYVVEEMEQYGGAPLWGPIVREIGAPAVLAGLVGPFENPVPDQIGDYLRGGTYVIDKRGRGLAHVAFPDEGVAIAEIPLRPELSLR
jgi:hypothetical protein